MLALLVCQGEGLLLSDLASGREDLGDDIEDILLGGTVVHDAGPQGKLTVYGGIRDIDAAALDHSLEDGAVLCVEIAIASFEAKADCAERDGREQFKFGVGRNCIRQSPRQTKIFGDR